MAKARLFCPFSLKTNAGIRPAVPCNSPQSRIGVGTCRCNQIMHAYFVQSRRGPLLGW